MANKAWSSLQCHKHFEQHVALGCVKTGFPRQEALNQGNNTVSSVCERQTFHL